MEGWSEARLGGEGRGNTRQKSRGKEKRRDFYKTHPSPNPGPRRDTDTYRLTVPTYNPTTTMDPLRAKKRKKKGVTGRGRGQKRAVHLRRGGNERKSGNDESIVPVQRLFSQAFEAASPSSPPSLSSARSSISLPPSLLFLCVSPDPLSSFSKTASRLRHAHRLFETARWLHAYGQLGRLPTDPDPCFFFQGGRVD